MKVKLTSIEKYCKLREERLSKWHKWFAWRPVRINDEHMVWLEFVFRRIDPATNALELFYVADYREYNAIEALKIIEEQKHS
jgi:hypothetical protein